MMNFETPDHATAYMLGISLETLARMDDAAEAFFEEFGYTQPYLDREDRILVDESDMELVSEQDYRDLEITLAWEAFMGFGN